MRTLSDKLCRWQSQHVINKMTLRVTDDWDVTFKRDTDHTTLLDNIDQTTKPDEGPLSSAYSLKSGKISFSPARLPPPTLTISNVTVAGRKTIVSSLVGSPSRQHGYLPQLWHDKMSRLQGETPNTRWRQVSRYVIKRLVEVVKRHKRSSSVTGGHQASQEVVKRVKRIAHIKRHQATRASNTNRQASQASEVSQTWHLSKETRLNNNATPYKVFITIHAQKQQAVSG